VQIASSKGNVATVRQGTNGGGRMAGAPAGGADPYRILADLYSADRTAFNGGVGGYGATAWDAKPTHLGNPPPTVAALAGMRLQIENDPRMRPRGFFVGQLAATQATTAWDQAVPYFADESPAGGRASINEWQQMCKVWQMRLHVCASACLRGCQSAPPAVSLADCCYCARRKRQSYCTNLAWHA